MQLLRAIRLRLIAYFMRAIVHTRFFYWPRLMGRPLHFSKFSPDRSFTINSTVSRRSMKVNVFQPETFDARKKYPVYINLHGSGFIISMLGSDADFCRFVTNQTGAIVLDCDYAKGPEWPFPAPSDDIKDIVEHVAKNREGYLDASKIAIGGFSAGGCLALASCARQPVGTIKAIIAFYPATDLSIITRARPEGAPKPPPAWLNRFFYDSCFNPGVDRLDPRFSPIMTPVSSFPEHVLLVTCAQDPLQYEEAKFADRLKSGGINVVRKHLAGVGHGWDKEAQGGTPGGAAKHESYVAAVEMLKLAFKRE